MTGRGGKKAGEGDERSSEDEGVKGGVLVISAIRRMKLVLRGKKRSIRCGVRSDLLS